MSASSASQQRVTALGVLVECVPGSAGGHKIKGGGVNGIIGG